jgi:hypothetical protein
MAAIDSTTLRSRPWKPACHTRERLKSRFFRSQ